MEGKTATEAVMAQEWERVECLILELEVTALANEIEAAGGRVNLALHRHTKRELGMIKEELVKVKGQLDTGGQKGEVEV